MLYLVATPIGNLGDFSPRAREVLEKVDLVACEDTRTSRGLFSLLGIQVKATTAYHDFNEEKATDSLIKKLKSGLDIALVSDAGMPLISDPGYRLVKACHENDIPVTSVPGANAVLTALQLSGLPSNAFYFGGFLPPKSGARQSVLKGVESLPATLIFYETARRLKEALVDIQKILGNRPMAVVRELTKKFEEVRCGTPDEINAYYSTDPKGEIVLVISGAEEKQNVRPALSISDLRQNLSAKDTAFVWSLLTGKPKKEAYHEVLENDKL
ncbi:MAG: 16S rRNA (cytidine(1402)-2'-O)-methyltransferase [Alphaproteobacteria bacterium]|nr:16S rRNA (cytidine(1402)-2'-O)-methyltransferase [Alphaproteobacteria bacterium]